MSSAFGPEPYTNRAAHFSSACEGAETMLFETNTKVNVHVMQTGESYRPFVVSCGNQHQ